MTKKVRDARTDGHGGAVTELQGVTIAISGAAPSFTYGLRRPGLSSPDVPRATVPQGAVCQAP